MHRLEPIRKFVATLRKRQDAVIAFIDTHVANAIAEGIDRIIKTVKNRASGYRNLTTFTDMIYLTVGDLDDALSNTVKMAASLGISGRLPDHAFARSGYTPTSGLPA